MKTTAFLIAALVMLRAMTAEAAVLCARLDKDGSFNGTVAIRDVCKSKETALDLAALGLQGPRGERGPQGEPGSGGNSLAGIPCDTGSIDKPEGRSVVSVDAGTGALTLTCISATTNPMLSVALAAGPKVCSGIGPITFCSFVRFAVVDADGDFACTSPPNLSPVPTTCGTQRFQPGGTVRLRAIGATNFAPVWAGCDAVAGDTCTIVLSGDRVVSVVPVAP
jgi:hypothetical protein